MIFIPKKWRKTKPLSPFKFLKSCYVNIVHPNPFWNKGNPKRFNVDVSEMVKFERVKFVIFLKLES